MVAAATCLSIQRRVLRGCRGLPTRRDAWPSHDRGAQLPAAREPAATVCASCSPSALRQGPRESDAHKRAHHRAIDNRFT